MGGGAAAAVARRCGRVETECESVVERPRRKKRIPAQDVSGPSSGQ
jgi:hypothetical protein